MNQLNQHQVSIKSLILVPALITLGVTLLRLAGELMDWSPLFFNREVGGGGALVGIIWLVPIFGFYFAHKLMNLNVHPTGAGRVFGFSFLALAVCGALLAFGFSLPTASLAQFLMIAAGSVVGILIARKGWPELASTLLAYGLAARIPVALVVLFAIAGDWRTHYDVPPPGLPEMGTFSKWLAIGLIPQLTLWLVVTVIFGAIFGGLAVVVMKRGQVPAEAVS